MTLKDRDRQKWVKTAKEWKPPEMDLEVTTAKEDDRLILMDEEEDPEKQWIESDYYIPLRDDE